jgi:UDP-glucose 4-epimerase
MHVLITGGAGFIGSHLAERCLNDGWRVSVIDDLSTGSFDNIAHLKGAAGFAYVLDSVFNRPLMAELVDSCDLSPGRGGRCAAGGREPGAHD